MVSGGKSWKILLTWMIWGYPHGLDTSIFIRVQIRGRSCAEDFDRYKTQSIRPATTTLDAWSHFCNYKLKSTTWFDSENNSRYALQRPMHLKSKNSWTSDTLPWIFAMTFCSWLYAIQSSDQHTFQKTFCSCHWLNLIGSSVDLVQLLDTILYWQRVNHNYRLRTSSEFNYRLGSGSGFNYRLCIGSGFKIIAGFEDHKKRSKTSI